MEETRTGKKNHLGGKKLQLWGLTGYTGFFNPQTKPNECETGSRRAIKVQATIYEIKGRVAMPNRPKGNSSPPTLPNALTSCKREGLLAGEAARGGHPINPSHIFLPEQAKDPSGSWHAPRARRRATYNLSTERRCGKYFSSYMKTMKGFDSTLVTSAVSKPRFVH